MTTASDPMADVAFAFAPLTGAIEQGLAAHPGAAQDRARWLLDSVVTGLARAGAPVTVSDLTLTQFDAVLAAFYRAHYDDALPAQARCTACNEPFEVSFRLSDVQARLAAAAAGYGGDHAGSLTAPSGRVFRLPRVADLALLRASASEDWLRGLLEDGDFDAAALQDEIEEAGPMLSQDIAAACPDCGAANTIRFDLADFVTSTLAGEAAFLWREVHLVAHAYGWALSEILLLPRGVRRQLAGLVVSDTLRLRRAS